MSSSASVSASRVRRALRHLTRLGLDGAVVATGVDARDSRTAAALVRWLIAAPATGAVPGLEALLEDAVVVLSARAGPDGGVGVYAPSAADAALAPLLAGAPGCLRLQPPAGADVDRSELAKASALPLLSSALLRVGKKVCVVSDESVTSAADCERMPLLMAYALGESSDGASPGVGRFFTNDYEWAHGAAFAKGLMAAADGEVLDTVAAPAAARLAASYESVAKGLVAGSVGAPNRRLALDAGQAVKSVGYDHAYAVMQREDTRPYLGGCDRPTLAMGVHAATLHELSAAALDDDDDARFARTGITPAAVDGATLKAGGAPVGILQAADGVTGAGVCRTVFFSAGRAAAEGDADSAAAAAAMVAYAALAEAAEESVDAALSAVAQDPSASLSAATLSLKATKALRSALASNPHPALADAADAVVLVRPFDALGAPLAAVSGDVPCLAYVRASMPVAGTKTAVAVGDTYRLPLLPALGAGASALTASTARWLVHGGSAGAEEAAFVAAAGALRKPTVEGLGPAVAAQRSTHDVVVVAQAGDDAGLGGAVAHAVAGQVRLHEGGFTVADTGLQAFAVSLKTDVVRVRLADVPLDAADADADAGAGSDSDDEDAAAAARAAAAAVATGAAVTVLLLELAADANRVEDPTPYGPDAALPLVGRTRTLALVLPRVSAVRAAVFEALPLWRAAAPASCEFKASARALPLPAATAALVRASAPGAAARASALLCARAAAADADALASVAAKLASAHALSPTVESAPTSVLVLLGLPGAGTHALGASLVQRLKDTDTDGGAWAHVHVSALGETAAALGRAGGAGRVCVTMAGTATAAAAANAVLGCGARLRAVVCVARPEAPAAACAGGAAPDAEWPLGLWGMMVPGWTSACVLRDGKDKARFERRLRALAVDDPDGNRPVRLRVLGAPGANYAPGNVLEALAALDDFSAPGPRACRAALAPALLDAPQPPQTSALLGTARRAPAPAGPLDPAALDAVLALLFPNAARTVAALPAWACPADEGQPPLRGMRRCVQIAAKRLREQAASAARVDALKALGAAAAAAAPAAVAGRVTVAQGDKTWDVLVDACAGAAVTTLATGPKGGPTAAEGLAVRGCDGESVRALYDLLEAAAVGRVRFPARKALTEAGVRGAEGGKLLQRILDATEVAAGDWVFDGSKWRNFDGKRTSLARPDVDEVVEAYVGAENEGARAVNGAVRL